MVRRLVISLIGLMGVVLASVAMGVSAGPALAAGDANEAACPNESSPGFKPYLPDCRGYELVTPPDKQGALVDPVDKATVAADGSSLAGSSPEAFAGLSNDELRALDHAYYRFTRSGSGWVTAPLNPPHGELVSIGVGDSVWGPAETSTAVTRLRLRQADGSLSEIGPVWPPALGPNQKYYPFFVPGAANDASHGVVFTIMDSALFWPFDTTLSAPSLYEYTGIGNAAPSLVGVSGGAGSTTLISQCGTTLGASNFVSGGNSEYNAVSEDGSTVFFTAAGADSVSCAGTEPPANELFARVGGSRTVAISEPSTADCPACNTSAPMDTKFEGASADGSKVFFTTTQPLLGADTSANLYEYDFNPPAGQPKVVRVSGGDGTVSNPTAEVRGVSRISKDGSHIYFVARGLLSTGANGESQSAQVGADNLYLYERDARYPTGRTVFIAELCSDAGKSGAVADSQCPNNLNPGQGIDDEALWGGDQGRPVQATPDGRFLVFTSYGNLTAGDTSSASQVFQYDAQAGRLVRVSIGLDGYHDNGNAVGSGKSSGNDAGIVTQDYSAGTRGGAIARTMSDDGSYVFFQSPVGLTPQALNDVQINVDGGGNPLYAQNVYEYHNGHISLIGSDASSAHIGSRRALIGTSASGGDVFFRTTDQLVPQDTDTQMDFYDARIGGGFPAPAGPAACQGDGCQGSPGAPPPFGSPSSATFSGAGNLVVQPSVTHKKAKKKPRKRRASKHRRHKRRGKAAGAPHRGRSARSTRGGRA